MINTVTQHRATKEGRDFLKISVRLWKLQGGFHSTQTEFQYNCKWHFSWVAFENRLIVTINYAVIYVLPHFPAASKLRYAKHTKFPLISSPQYCTQLSHPAKQIHALVRRFKHIRVVAKTHFLNK